MHPENRKALQKLQEATYINTICRKIMNIGYERIFRGENFVNMVKCSENRMPHILELMKQVATKVGFSVPEVYVYNDPIMNAYTINS